MSVDKYTVSRVNNSRKVINVVLSWITCPKKCLKGKGELI